MEFFPLPYADESVQQWKYDSKCEVHLISRHISVYQVVCVPETATTTCQNSKPTQTL